MRQGDDEKPVRKFESTHFLFFPKSLTIFASFGGGFDFFQYEHRALPLQHGGAAGREPEKEEEQGKEEYVRRVYLCFMC